MASKRRSRLVQLRSAGGGVGPLVIAGLVLALAVMIAIVSVWDPCPAGTERQCGTVVTGELVGHACECVET